MIKLFLKLTPMCFALIGVAAWFCLQEEIETLSPYFPPLGVTYCLIPLAVFFYVGGMVSSIVACFVNQKIRWSVLSIFSFIFSSFSLLLAWILILRLYCTCLGKSGS